MFGNVVGQLRIPVNALLRGFFLIRQPRFRHYVWRPMACSLLTVSMLVLFTFSYVMSAAESIMHLLPDWLSFLGSILVPILYVTTVLASGWLVGFVALIIASPFLGSLSSRTDAHENGVVINSDESLTDSFISSYKRELSKLRYHVTMLLAALILGLVLSPIAPIIWLLVGAWLTAIQFIDHASENRNLPFSHTRKLLRANPGPTIVFGSLVAGLLALPFLNIFSIPACVCGGTILWNVLHEPHEKSSRVTTFEQ